MRKANDGSVAIAASCLGATVVGAAVDGQITLIDALRKDPDTPYPVPDSKVARSMREITVGLISTLSSIDSCSSDTARALQTAIDGLPR